MVIDKTIIRNLEKRYKSPIPEECKQYLLVNYAQEPFPNEYSEQDLYANIERDMDAFVSGCLDVTMKTPSERWQEECENLKEMYFEKSCETHELLEYVAELEHILLEHGLESSKMAKKRIALSNI